MLTDALKATMPLEDLSSKRGRRGNQSNVHDHARKAEAAFENRREFGTILPGTPTTGRSREVSYNDVAGAYRQLMAILRRNEVRKELRLGDRYEKPNQERRRKRSERHRRRFADMIRKKVQLVSELGAIVGVEGTLIAIVRCVAWEGLGLHVHQKCAAITRRYLVVKQRCRQQASYLTNHLAAKSSRMQQATLRAVYDPGHLPS